MALTGPNSSALKIISIAVTVSYPDAFAKRTNSSASAPSATRLPANTPQAIYEEICRSFRTSTASTARWGKPLCAAGQPGFRGDRAGPEAFQRRHRRATLCTSGRRRWKTTANTSPPPASIITPGWASTLGTPSRSLIPSRILTSSSGRKRPTCPPLLRSTRPNHLLPLELARYAWDIAQEMKRCPISTAVILSTRAV